MRLLDYSPLLNRYHDITAGDAAQAFSYPRIDSAFRQNKDSLGFYWYAHNNSAAITARPILAFDMRGGKAAKDTVMAYEMGMFLSGYIDSVEFWLDTRIFSEGHSAECVSLSNPKCAKPWDREFVENQGNKGIEGEI
jgi:hypothetical protein